MKGTAGDVGRTYWGEQMGVLDYCVFRGMMMIVVHVVYLRKGTHPNIHLRSE